MKHLSLVLLLACGSSTSTTESQQNLTTQNGLSGFCASYSPVVTPLQRASTPRESHLAEMLVLETSNTVVASDEDYATTIADLTLLNNFYPAASKRDIWVSSATTNWIRLIVEVPGLDFEALDCLNAAYDLRGHAGVFEYEIPHHYSFSALAAEYKKIAGVKEVYNLRRPNYVDAMHDVCMSAESEGRVYAFLDGYDRRGNAANYGTISGWRIDWSGAVTELGTWSRQAPTALNNDESKELPAWLPADCAANLEIRALPSH